MKDISDNGETARAIEETARPVDPAARLSQTIERLIGEVTIGRTTVRTAMTTIMLKALRAGRDLEIAAQLEAAKSVVRGLP